MTRLGTTMRRAQAGIGRFLGGPAYQQNPSPSGTVSDWWNAARPGLSSAARGAGNVLNMGRGVAGSVGTYLGQLDPASLTPMPRGDVERPRIPSLPATMARPDVQSTAQTQSRPGLNLPGFGAGLAGVYSQISPLNVTPPPAAANGYLNIYKQALGVPMSQASAGPRYSDDMERAALDALKFFYFRDTGQQLGLPAPTAQEIAAHQTPQPSGFAIPQTPGQWGAMGALSAARPWDQSSWDMLSRADIARQNATSAGAYRMPLTPWEDKTPLQRSQTGAMQDYQAATGNRVSTTPTGELRAHPMGLSPPASYFQPAPAEAPERQALRTARLGSSAERNESPLVQWALENNKNVGSYGMTTSANPQVPVGRQLALQDRRERVRERGIQRGEDRRAARQPKDYGDMLENPMLMARLFGKPGFDAAMSARGKRSDRATDMYLAGMRAANDREVARITAEGRRDTPEEQKAAMIYGYLSEAVKSGRMDPETAYDVQQRMMGMTPTRPGTSPLPNKIPSTPEEQVAFEDHLKGMFAQGISKEAAAGQLTRPGGALYGASPEVVADLMERHWPKLQKGSPAPEGSTTRQKRRQAENRARADELWPSIRGAGF